MASHFSVHLPAWVPEFLRQHPAIQATAAERMRFVLQLTRRHITEQTGGPFGAAVFEQASGRLVAVGLNRVVPAGLSSAHAEIVALSLAQRELGSFDLGAPQLPALELVVNAQMCAMCLGAVIWSGVRSVSYAVAGKEVEALTGFDEGPVPTDVRGELARRGITLQTGVLAEEGAAVLREYVQTGGLIYNARRENSP